MERISQKTGRATLKQEIAEKVRELNALVEGWGNYFSLGPVSKAYRAVDAHVRYRLRQWLCSKHQQQGAGTSAYPEEYLYETLGLVRLEKTVLPTNEWDWLCLAQHHGLPTRLLDWSYNPLSAIYFSVEADSSVDGKLFALDAPKQAPSDVRANSPFSIKKPEKLFPNIVSPRIRAQEGLFVVCSELETPLDERLREDWSIERHRIPAEKKEILRYELFRLGVHASAMFPGVEGLAARLKWQHSVVSPFKPIT
jgi:hypothetical protein